MDDMFDGLPAFLAVAKHRSFTAAAELRGEQRMRKAKAKPTGGAAVIRPSVRAR